VPNEHEQLRTSSTVRWKSARKRYIAPKQILRGFKINRLRSQTLAIGGRWQVAPHVEQSVSEEGFLTSAAKLLEELNHHNGMVVTDWVATIRKNYVGWSGLGQRTCTATSRWLELSGRSYDEASAMFGNKKLPATAKHGIL